MIARICQNQDLQDWRDLQDFAFAFAQLALFAKTIADERPTNPENPIIPQILILTRRAPAQALPEANMGSF